MKKNRLYILFAIVVGSFSYSCNDWLEVDSDARVVQEDLFSTGDGFRSALNGIYRLLGEKELYAMDLTWGMASVLGHNYEVSRMPYNYQLLEEDYEYEQSLDIIDPIWSKGFRVIANCNNLIQETEKKDTSFFELGKVEKDLIIGEAIGVRAMMHLELLRLFAPAPILDDGKLYMPYVCRYPEHQPQYLTVSAVLDSVINDLQKAKEMLVYHDTLYNYWGVYSASCRIGESYFVQQKGGTFFNARGTRMNYFAASALLARAYLYRGDKRNAYHYAEAVYQFASRKKWYTFTASYNLAPADNNAIYRKMYEDIILAAVNTNLYDIVKDANVNNTFFYYKNVDELFGADLDDFRKTKLIETDGSSRRWAMPTGNLAGYPTINIVKYQGPLAPIIRLSEVVYIMCECLADSDMAKAIELLEWVRTARGAKAPLDKGMTETMFLEVLYNEIIRESMSEGQSFFMHKRLNRPIFNGDVTVDMAKRWVLPIPYDESAYMNL